MAMTDADVDAMAAQVLASVEDPEAAETWRKDVLKSWRAVEQKQMAEWKLGRFLRDDNAMTSIAQQLERTRAAIAYLVGLEPHP